MKSSNNFVGNAFSKYFQNLRQLGASLRYVFSKQARFAGKFDERDLLLGHGIDNLTSIRVVLVLCFIIALYLLCDFLVYTHILSALLFVVLMEALCLYCWHLPRSGMEQAQHSSLLKFTDKRSYRSYLNGRILFTPYGLSLSMRARNAATIANERHDMAYQILHPNDKSKLSKLRLWWDKVKRANRHLHLDPFLRADFDEAQVNNLVNKAQQEHNARLYLSGQGHKSAAMILQSGVNVEDYVIAQGVIAATSDESDLPVANSGYITKVPVPLLCDQRIYAGKNITMEAIAQILSSCARQESIKQKKSFVPTDLCLLGFGFEWLPKHSRALRQIMAVGAKSAPLGGDGSPDIHAVEIDHAYEPIVTSTTKLKGHTLLLGTTGSGKTRFFDLLVSQAIMRGDTVIVLDPKGDRDLQRSIIKASRAAEREPYQDIICLDIGRDVSNPLSSNVAIDYAAASTGTLKQFAMDSRRVTMTNNNAPLSPFERSRHNLTTQGHLSLINEDFLERAGASSENSDSQDRHAFSYYQNNYIKGHNETPASIRASKMRYSDPNFATVFSPDPDDRLFDEINFGLNPTSVFDRASEVASRLSSMVGGEGSSANFKAYAAMAITAAVECCRLLDETVTLDAIRGYIANHQKFLLAIRDIMNKTVVNLNNVYCSRYYNRIYGIRDEKLVKNAYSISVLMSNGYKYINVRERAAALAILQNSGLLDKSEEQLEDSEKLKQIENIVENSNLTKEILSDKTTKRSMISSKNKSSSENKPRYLASPAPIKALQEFYLWLTKNSYIDRDNSIEQIFEVCLMDPLFFQKVTNSIMPSLVSLTSGVLKQLLSADDYKQTNFMEIVRNNKIFYSALHCLKDSITGQNLGKLLMADLAYVAGEINAKNIHGHHQVSVFIDEASELANEVLVQLLNKSRASNFAVTIATQSVADLRARVNSKDAADQLIANCNNLLSLRVEDVDTANVIAKVLPHTVCTYESTTISVSTGGLNGSANASRSLNQQDCEYFPATMLMQLPNFEFIARLANGSCYKGFIPIIDKNNSGLPRITFDNAQEAQQYAREQNERMRKQSFDKNNDRARSGARPDFQVALDTNVLNHSHEASYSTNSKEAQQQRFKNYVNALKQERDHKVQRQTDFQSVNELSPKSAKPCTTEDVNVAPSKLEQIQAQAQQEQNDSLGTTLHDICNNYNMSYEQACKMIGIDEPHDPNDSQSEVGVDKLGYQAGYSRPTLEQENKVYVGNEQSLLYSHFKDSEYQNYNNDNFATLDNSANSDKTHNAFRSEVKLSGDGHHKRSAAPIMVSALETSKSKMNREYEHNKDKDKEINVGAKASFYQEFGLTGLLVGGVRILLLPLQWLIKLMICLMFNQKVLKHLQIAKELSILLLVATVVISFVNFNSNETPKHEQLLADLSYNLSYLKDFALACYYVVGHGFTNINEALYSNSSIIERLSWYVNKLIENLPSLLCSFALGLLWGNYYGLMSEMRHRSLLGLRSLLRPYSFFNLSLTVSAIAMLVLGVFPCLEYALAITWLKIAIYGFLLTCFYSQHTK